MPVGSYYFKNLNIPRTHHFLKVNTRPLITSDSKILNIHNQTLLGNNNNVSHLSKIQINNCLILECVTFRLKKKNFFRFSHLNCVTFGKKNSLGSLEIFILKYPNPTII